MLRIGLWFEATWLKVQGFVLSTFFHLAVKDNGIRIAEGGYQEPSWPKVQVLGFRVQSSEVQPCSDL